MPDIFTPTSINDSPKPKPIVSAMQEETSVVIKKPPHTHHFASFCDHPEGINFENQEADEEILLFLRRHFITNVPWIAATIILLILPPFLIFTLPFLPSFLSSLPPEFGTILLLFYYLLVFNFALLEFITWYFNISLVTQKRIVDIDFSDLLYHDVAVTKLSLVEETNYNQVGFVRSLFNYGDVFVQTAAEKLHFDFLAVPQPRKVIEIVQNLIGRRSNGSH